MGFMWECPDTFKLNGKDVFMFSPQGMNAVGLKYHNVYQSGYAVGAFDQTKQVLSLGAFDELVYHLLMLELEASLNSVAISFQGLG